MDQINSNRVPSGRPRTGDPSRVPDRRSGDETAAGHVFPPRHVISRFVSYFCKGARLIWRGFRFHADDMVAIIGTDDARKSFEAIAAPCDGP